jgi:hypothetical protein
MIEKYIVAVHFQSMNKGRQLAETLFSSGKPFLAFVVPNLLEPEMKTKEGEEIFDRIHPSEIYYQQWAIDIFRKNKNNSDVIWGQEGYRHCCGRCFNQGMAMGKKSPDPYHEHVCLDGYVQSFDVQKNNIRKGKRILIEKLGVNATIYCSANHLDNEDTLRAIKSNGFSGMITRNGFDYIPLNCTKMPLYKNENGLIILPETKNRNSPVRMVYYDDDSENILKLLSSSVPLSELLIEEVSLSKIKKNKELILEYKKLRDVAYLSR